MKRLLFLLLLSAVASAQQLHTFKNGEVADAEQINQNFNYVLENASGGCTVEQVENTAEITCADGSTAVVPGYGTVLIFPEGGVSGEVPIEYNTGALVVMDANDVAIAGATSGGSGEYDVVIPSPTDDFPRYRLARISNNDATNTVELGEYRDTPIFFQSDDCTGLSFSSVREYLVVGEQEFFITSPGSLPASVFYSQINLQSECEVGEVISSAWPLVEYTPAPEILNAAYPVRLEQLP